MSAILPMVMKMIEIPKDGAPTVEIMRMLILNAEAVARIMVDQVLANTLMVLVLSPITVPDMIVTVVVMVVMVI